ncbi:MAG: hypothetical protein NC417_09635 [Candidatus Gastranaerophilales bacterium]|nr:hypothetical protein [Candidatus Gastranaerophilales bacterium]
MKVRFEQIKMQAERKFTEMWGRLGRAALQKEAGIDGILVTVGLCVIALLLCVVMKDSLTDFIEILVQAMTDKAKNILSGTAM